MSSLILIYQSGCNCAVLSKGSNWLTADNMFAQKVLYNRYDFGGTRGVKMADSGEKLSKK